MGGWEVQAQPLVGAVLRWCRDCLSSLLETAQEPRCLLCHQLHNHRPHGIVNKANLDLQVHFLVFVSADVVCQCEGQAQLEGLAAGCCFFLLHAPSLTQELCWQDIWKREHWSVLSTKSFSCNSSDCVSFRAFVFAVRQFTRSHAALLKSKGRDWKCHQFQSKTFSLALFFSFSRVCLRPELWWSGD